MPGCCPTPIVPEQRVTPNYKLPQWDATTVTSWLTQMNYAMLTIDTVMHNLALRTSFDGEIPPELISDVERLNAQMQTVAAQVADFDGRIALLETKQTSMETSLATAKQDIGTLQVNYSNLDTRVSTLELQMTNLTANVNKIAENLDTLTQRVNGYHPS